MGAPFDAIDGNSCELAFIRSGRDPAHLARFLKKYPAAHHLGWVKATLAEWGASGDFDNLKLLQPARGQRKVDSGLRKVTTDFFIYRAVTRLDEQSHPLTSKDSIFKTLSETTTFNGASLSWEQIRDRYYRFCKHKAVVFIDDGKTMIMGPARMQVGDFEAVGFWTWKATWNSSWVIRWIFYRLRGDGFIDRSLIFTTSFRWKSESRRNIVSLGTVFGRDQRLSFWGVLNYQT
jgi:hypothetical protein